MLNNFSVDLKLGLFSVLDSIQGLLNWKAYLKSLSISIIFLNLHILAS